MLFENEQTVQAKPEMLVLVRESRGMTQAEVAEKMAKLSAASAGGTVSQGYVSRAEKGRLAVSGERLELYAQALECLPALLCLDPQVADMGIGLVHHRKKAALSAPALRRIHAQLALTRLHVQSLLDLTGASEAQFPTIEVDDANPPYEAAAAVRDAWGLPKGPVRNLVGWIERAGGIVLLRDLNSDHLDAISQWPAGRGPLLLVNSRAPGDRLRFSIAHELGHVTMHRVPGETGQQEREADEFAAAFLMPASDIREHFTDGVDLVRLETLKARWGVSMAALLRRAHSLGAITDWQYRNVTIEMSALGYRSVEPGEVDREQPTAVHDAVEQAERENLASGEDLAQLMYLHPEDLRRDYRMASGEIDQNQTTVSTEVRP